MTKQLLGIGCLGVGFSFLRVCGGDWGAVCGELLGRMV